MLATAHLDYKWVPKKAREEERDVPEGRLSSATISSWVDEIRYIQNYSKLFINRTLPSLSC